jgi:hypothetical protein
MKSGEWCFLCGVVLVVLLAGSGCAGQRLAMMDARSEPAEVSPGDESFLSVTVVDPQGVVAAVTATVREDSVVRLPLNDSGEDGDKVAGDGVWSLAFEIPYDAPAREYHWDFEAFDADGDPVKVTTEEGGEEPLTAEAPVEVVY